MEERDYEVLWRDEVLTTKLIIVVKASTAEEAMKKAREKAEGRIEGLTMVAVAPTMTKW